MIRYILDGQPCEPANRTDVNFRIDFTKSTRISEFEITVDSLEFVREDRERIMNHLAMFGRYQGMPLDIIFSNGRIIKYYIDFTDASIKWDDISFSAKIKRYKATNNFYDNADGLSWRLVTFQNSDFTNIDYVVVKDNQALTFITLSLATFGLSQELAKSIQAISEGIADLVQAVTPVGLPVPAPNFGAIIAASIKLTARIVYAVFILVALIQLISQIIEIIIPKIRTLKGITYKRLIEVGCAHLGFTVESNFLNEIRPLTFLGAPLRSTEGSIFREIFLPNTLAFTDGFPNEADSIPTLGEAIKKLEELYNLRSVVEDGVFKLERDEFFTQINSEPIPLAYNEQSSKLEQRSFNQDFWKRKLFVWTKDFKDTNTYDDTKGHIMEVDTSVTTSPDRAIQLLKGLERINNPFSLGTRKDSLSFAEKSLKTLAKAVDLFTGGSLASKINNRVGVLQLSEQYFSNNKLLWMDGNRISVNHREKLSAKNIINTYHDTKDVSVTTREVIEDMPIRMTEDEFLLFSQQNLAKLNNNLTIKILSLQWSELEHEASCSFEVDSLFNVNTTKTVLNAGNI